MSDQPEQEKQLAALVPSLNATIDRLVAERDAAESRYVKQRQECDEQEDEIARLTSEIDTRKAMFARLQEEYDAAKPYIHDRPNLKGVQGIVLPSDEEQEEYKPSLLWPVLFAVVVLAAFVSFIVLPLWDWLQLRS